ncbi:MAG TPA: DUF4956 domain-containing protein [Verrucomicrobiae bacterium]|nr:DUF4956 domain-containing protein [Verrucomicrobiae bacterium]
MPPEAPKLAQHDWTHMLVNLCVAFVAGLLVTAIYRGTRPKSHITPSFPPTLVLLAILLAMVTQVIGESLARAFGLVGALSIVRFRTVVRDTQDTAFVIFAVVVGMAAGASAYTIAALGLAVGGVAAALVRTKSEIGWDDTENTLNLRLGLGVDQAALLKDAFEKSVEAFEILSVVTAKGGAALEYIYRVRMKPGFEPGPFVRELNQLDGVQNVELRRGEPELA